ncbi:unnamed protein product [Allacma fusca]|uniref:Uncharacterized protein n=1 Tax=Allacma fusca TaxID=39272 RepID=A0A8J2JSV4_9HEXA|nr:unnamed protein product [Allacma fusca]
MDVPDYLHEDEIIMFHTNMKTYVPLLQIRIKEEIILQWMILDCGGIADCPTAVFDRKRKSLHDVFLQCSQESNKVKKQDLDLKKMGLDLQVKRLENETRQRDLVRVLVTRRIAIQT